MGPRSRLQRFRPGFMAGVMLCALALMPLLGWLAENLVDERTAQAEMLAQADRGLRDEMLELGWEPLPDEGATELSKTRGVEFLAARRDFALALANGTVRGAAASDAQAAAVQVVKNELSRYPRSFFERARLSRVLLCSGLEEAGTRIPSLPNFHRTLLLDVDSDAQFMRRLLHHEIFHFVDYADDDQLRADPEWEKLNDRWFVYGSGGRFERDPRSALPSDVPGFVTRYAQSALEEDKAETFAFWMTDRGWITARAARDRVLAAKVNAVQAQLSRAGLELTSPPR